MLLASYCMTWRRWRGHLHFFSDNSGNNLKYAVIFAHTDKSNTSFETVKGFTFISISIKVVLL